MSHFDGAKKALDEEERVTRHVLTYPTLTAAERVRAEESLRRISGSRRRLDRWELFHAVLQIPRRDSSLLHRSVWAAGLCLVMPVLWPVLMAIFGVCLLVITLVMAVLVLVLPIVAFMGFPEDGNETLEVTVPKERAAGLRKELEAAGAKVKVS